MKTTICLRQLYRIANPYHYKNILFYVFSNDAASKSNCQYSFVETKTSVDLKLNTHACYDNYGSKDIMSDPDGIRNLLNRYEEKLLEKSDRMAQQEIECLEHKLLSIKNKIEYIKKNGIDTIIGNFNEKEFIKKNTETVRRELNNIINGGVSHMEAVCNNQGQG